MTPPKKIDQLRELMSQEQWEKALALAAKFPRLGAEKAVIIRAHECYAHPRFYAQLGIDLAAAKEAGKHALQHKYM